MVDYESLMDFSVYLPCMYLAFECVLSFAWIHNVVRGFRSAFHRLGWVEGLGLDTMRFFPFCFLGGQTYWLARYSMGELLNATHLDVQLCFQEGLPLGQCFEDVLYEMKLRNTTPDGSDFSLAILLPKNSKP